MNIKRVVEKDTRTAFEMIKEQYGEDVVILSNKRVGNQVEIMVAIDLNDGSYNLQNDPESGVGKAKSVESKKVHAPDEAKNAPTVAWMEARKKADTASAMHSQEPLSEKESIEHLKKLLEKTRAPVESARVVEYPALATENELDDIKFEMSQLRDMFKTHIDITARNEREALSVDAKNIIEKLEAQAISAEHVGVIQNEILSQGRKRDFWKKTVAWLNADIINSPMDIVNDGGIYAFVGLSGVGKTTTIAKLASQAALKYGKDEVALITLDHNRIGSKEQMKLFGMMLGVNVVNASNTAELRDRLCEVEHKRVVLIDTAGVSLRNDSLRVNCEALKSSHLKLNVVLALSANSQSAGNDKICQDVDDLVCGTIITKLDEAMVLGGLISTLRNSGLGLIGVSCGQEIPNDYQSFSPAELIDKCFSIEQNINTEKPAQTQQASAA